MPGMGAGGQPAAAPLAQAESAADFTEQVSCHNTVDLTSSAVKQKNFNVSELFICFAIKGGKNEGDGYCG